MQLQVPTFKPGLILVTSEADMGAMGRRQRVEVEQVVATNVQPVPMGLAVRWCMRTAAWFV